MTLALGTALQNGTYVIDALGTEDAIGSVYLATHLPTGQWVQVRVLGSHHPEAIPDLETRQRFYQYLDQVNTLEQQSLSAQVSGFEEDGVCYQIFAAALGTPLVQLVTVPSPLPPRRSLTVIHKLLEALSALRTLDWPLGWHSLRLTPDQLWQSDSALAFTGFDFPREESASTTSGESAVVEGLSHLLYFLLTGQRAETTRAPLEVDLRHRLPGLPLGLEQALRWGKPQAEPIPTLDEWQCLLPPLAQLPPDPPPSPQPVPRFHTPIPVTTSPASNHSSNDPARLDQHDGIKSKTQLAAPLPPGPVAARPAPWAAPPRAKSSRRPATLALVATGLVASISGLSFGLHARLRPLDTSPFPDTPKTSRFDPNQSFPPLSDWSHDELWQPWEAAPAPSLDRPDYGDRPAPPPEPAPSYAPPIAPVAPEPAVVDIEPEPETYPSDSFELPPAEAGEPLPGGEFAPPADPLTPAPRPKNPGGPAPPAPLQPVAPAPPVVPQDQVAPAPLPTPTRPAAPAPTSS
ncbi:MAG: hypothetical protein ACFCVD_09080 [Nodosilinea sp.]